MVEAAIWAPGAGADGTSPTGSPLPFNLPILPGHSPSPTPTASGGSPSGSPSSSATPTPAPSGAPPSGSLSLQLNESQLGSPYASALNGVEGPGVQVFDYAHQQWSAGVPSLLSGLHLHFERCCQPVNMSYCPGTSDCTYHWNAWQNSKTDISPQALVSSFQQVTAAGDTPLLIANVDRGTPQEAAGFVQEMNVTLGAHVTWWEIGNEEESSPALAGNLPPECAGTAQSGFGQMYGCVVHTYAAAMRAVDPTIKIVANAESQALSDMLSVAGPDINALDMHQYNAPADPSTSTFTGDMQSQDYWMQLPSMGLTEVTFAVWAGADEWTNQPVPSIRVFIDGQGVTSSAPGLQPSAWTPVYRGEYGAWPEPVVVHKIVSGGAHKLTVLACSSDNTSSFTASCNGSTMGKWNMAVRRVTWATPYNGVSVPTADQVEARNEGSGCFGAGGPDSAIYMANDGPTQVASSTQPWRLSQSDFDLAFTAGYADYMRNELQGPTLDHHSLRERLDAYNAAPPAGAAPWHGDVVIGEYSAFGGCLSNPRTLTESMAAAMGDAADLMHLIEDSSQSTYPVVAASHFALDATDSTACLGWTVVLTSGCYVGTSPFLGAEGNALSMLWSLSGTRVAASLLSCPTVNTGQLSATPPQDGSPLVRAVAYQPGAAGTLEIAVLNLSPSQSYALPIWNSGHTVSFVSSKSVAAAPDAYNGPGNQNAVGIASNGLSHSQTGSYTTVTLPAFSISLITVSIA